MSDPHAGGRRVKRLLLVHHSHTDVGYTAPPGVVVSWQTDWIREALRLAEASPRFRWTCECFWGVERFLAEADAAERDRFIAMVREGRIGLSASWLNLTELPDQDLHDALAARAGDFGRAIGVPLRCAMTADINGHSWGFCQSLLDQGVRFLFSCVHGHHGFAPLFHRHQPFWWKGPRDESLLVYNGEHYHLGNELGLAPGAVSSYLIKDECTAAEIHGDAWDVALRRVPRYLDELEKAGHPLDFAPLMISGLRTDNSPPGARILEHLDRWNRESGLDIEIRLASLEEVLEELEAAAIEWPVHRGDWPDWWSDGAASRPMAVKQFRQALRGRRLLRSAMGEAPGKPAAKMPDEDGLDTLLGLYAEHTFSHAASVTQPWHPRVQQIGSAKDGLASAALDLVEQRLSRWRRSLGDAIPRTGTAPSWEVRNPWPTPWSGPVLLPVEHYELNELRLDRPQRLVDAAGVDLPCQRRPEGFLTWLDIPGNGGLSVELKPAEPSVPSSLSPRTLLPADRVADLAPAGSGDLREAFVLSTSQGRLTWESGTGITGLQDRDGGSLLDSAEPMPPFTLIHELTPCRLPGQAGSVRGIMGRNRKGSDAHRGHSRWGRVLNRESGAVLEELELELLAPGCPWAVLVLRLYHAGPRLDVELRLHKESRWEPENLYFSLPRPGGVLWVDKAGGPLRPGVDQLPGSLVDFTSVQAGYCSVGPSRILAVAMPDQHLLQLGPLEYGPRSLAEPPRPQQGSVHAWLMTNYWETNFAAELGGFHSFRFSLHWGAELQDPQSALDGCRRAWDEPLVLRRGDQAWKAKS